MQRSLTQGPITRNMLLFALPLMCGNLLQQMYNIADTWVVGRFLGADALAAGVVDLIEDACGKLRIGEALSPVAWEGLFAPKTGIYTTKTFVWFDKYL